MIPALFTSTSGSEARLRCVEEGGERGGVGHVERKPDGALAESVRGGRRARLVEIADGHPGAAAHRLGRDRGADAARAAWSA